MAVEGEQAPGCRIRELESQLTRQLAATRQWCELASSMVSELRQDYVPGDGVTCGGDAALKMTDGVKAIVKLRAARDSLAAKLREVLVDISGYVATDEYDEERMAVGIPTAVLKSWIKALTTEPAAEAKGGRG